MITDIILRRDEILQKIEKAGIEKSNLLAVLLFGSHYWGYDRPESDIDLHILLKSANYSNSPSPSFQKRGTVRVPDFENLSLHYQETLEQTNEKIENGAWSTYYCINYASYLVYGERPKTSDFKKETFVNSLKKWEKTEWPEFSWKPRKWCFQALMKRIYFLNYFNNNVKTFKITDFQNCAQLTQDEIKFLEDQYVKIFKHSMENDIERDTIVELIRRVEEIIKKDLSSISAQDDK